MQEKVEGATAAESQVPGKWSRWKEAPAPTAEERCGTDQRCRRSLRFRVHVEMALLNSTSDSVARSTPGHRDQGSQGPRRFVWQNDGALEAPGVVEPGFGFEVDSKLDRVEKQHSLRLLCEIWRQIPCFKALRIHLFVEVIDISKRMCCTQRTQ